MSNKKTSNLWKADMVHSEAGFTITHLGISVMSGFFKNFDISLHSEDEDFSNASIEAFIKIDSLDTRVADRDHHLKGKDFFDSEQYPIASIQGKELKKSTGNTYRLESEVTIKGITKPATFELTFHGKTVNPMSQKQTAGFQLSGKLNRKDFGVASKIPGIVLSDEVAIHFNGEFVQ
jgi:polyisoprenoid-binding protein YceI